MLVLSRQKNESIQIGNDIVITILDVKGKRARIGIKAPENISIRRTELKYIEPREGGRVVADSRQVVDNESAA